MGLVPHHALVNNTAPFVTAFETIFSHGMWAAKLLAGLAVASGIGALNGWTLVTAEVSRAVAADGLFPRCFGWTDRKDSAWFGIVLAALLPRSREAPAGHRAPARHRILPADPAEHR